MLRWCTLLLTTAAFGASLGNPAKAHEDLVVRKVESARHSASCAYDSGSVRCWTSESGRHFLCIPRGCVAQAEVPDFLRRAEDAAPVTSADAPLQLGWGECILNAYAVTCFVGDYAATAGMDGIQIVDPQNNVSNH